MQRAWDRYDRLSVISAITLSPQKQHIGLPFQIYRENIKTAEVVQFIKELRRSLQVPMIVVLDRWSVHRAAAKRILSSKMRHIQFEWLPAYAPELNPVEARWSNTKYCALANFVPDDTCQLKRTVRKTLKQQSTNHELKKSFFQTANLKL
jgi:transposase